MVRLIIEVVLALASFAGGWYCAREFGAKGDAVVQAVKQ